MTTSRLHSALHKLLPLVALCAVMLASAAAQAQRGDLPGASIDPISFKGPDPAKRFKDIKIEQKLEAQIPLNLEFKNELGETVKLADYFGEKPVVLSLVYFRCASLCNLVLNGELAVFDAAANDLQLGEDYEAVTVSIDPRETPDLAAAKKEAYIKQYHKEGGADKGWHFLTGSEEAIETLATAVGYRYYFDDQTDQYVHDSGIIIATPQGKISSYYLGIEYLPNKFEYALVDASEGKIGSLVDQIVLLCYEYDPASGAYGLVIMRVLQLSGGATVAAILVFWLFMALGARRRALQEAADFANQPGGPVRTT